MNPPQNQGVSFHYQSQPPLPQRNSSYQTGNQPRIRYQSPTSISKSNRNGTKTNNAPNQTKRNSFQTKESPILIQESRQKPVSSLQLQTKEQLQDQQKSSKDFLDRVLLQRIQYSIPDSQQSLHPFEELDDEVQFYSQGFKGEQYQTGNYKASLNDLEEFVEVVDLPRQRESTFFGDVSMDDSQETSPGFNQPSQSQIKKQPFSKPELLRDTKGITVSQKTFRKNRKNRDMTCTPLSVQQEIAKKIKQNQQSNSPSYMQMLNSSISVPSSEYHSSQNFLKDSYAPKRIENNVTFVPMGSALAHVEPYPKDKSFVNSYQNMGKVNKSSEIPQNHRGEKIIGAEYQGGYNIWLKSRNQNELLNGIFNHSVKTVRRGNHQVKVPAFHNFPSKKEGEFLKSQKTDCWPNHSHSNGTQSQGKTHQISFELDSD